MNVIVFLAGLATVWLLLAAGPVALVLAEGQRERERHPDAAVLPGEFDRPAFGPPDDIEPRFAESADDVARPALDFVTDCERDNAADDLAESIHEDHERETGLMASDRSIRHARFPMKFELWI